jgi:hypothetical protein
MLKNVILPLLLLAIFSGCASVPVQQKAVHGVNIETLQGSVNVSLTSSVGQMSGNGFLFYKKPDSFRLSILAPFGQIVFDIIVSGENVICLQEKRKAVWQGTVNDLPPDLGTKVWPLLKWILEPPPPAGPSLERFFKPADGTIEIVYYDTGGLVQRKVNGFGDEAFYSDYRIADDRAIANRIELTASEGSRLVLTFDDPELNLPIDNSILSPDLAGYSIRPLRELNGFSSLK